MAVYVLVLLVLFLSSDVALASVEAQQEHLQQARATQAEAETEDEDEAEDDSKKAKATKAKTTTSTRPGPRAFTYTDAPRNEVRFSAGTPATKATTKLIALAEEIDNTRRDTTYKHSTRVRRKEGIYHFDCSGMLNWMLERVSKRSLETLDRERPVAATYVRTIQKAPSSRARKGWQNIVDIEDVEPGDLFAWRRPPDWPKGGNTGHVGIVIAQPAAVPYIENAYLVRVLDSTRYRHQDDTRSGDETGFGMGSILFMTDDDHHPIGYAWYGALSGGYYETDVVFGRIH